MNRDQQRDRLRTDTDSFIASARALLKRKEELTFDELVGLLNRSVKLTTAMAEIALVGSDDEERLQEIFRLHAQLDERGGVIEHMDASDLFRAKHTGLLSEEVVDGELARRRSTGLAGKPIIAAGMHLVGGAAVGGYLECGHFDCRRAVPAAQGPYCAEHRPSPPRQLITANLQAIDLDALLADAEKRAADARRALEGAERDIADLKGRIEAYDEAHSGA
jgi:hypothetical protein